MSHKNKNLLARNALPIMDSEVLDFIKNTDENSTVKKTANPYLSSNAGVMNRQTWYNITGKLKIIPPNNATLSFTVNMLVIFNTCRFKSIDSDSAGIISHCIIASEKL